MQDAFGYVLFAVVAVSAIAAALSMLGRAKLYEQIGRGAMSINEDADGRAAPAGGAAPVDAGVRDEEIRQMLRARNARHAAHGGQVVDVEAELARLTAPAVDDDLHDEVRALVIARNRRRVARGEQSLDVDAEVARQIRELGGS